MSYGFDGCGHLRIMVSFCSVIVMYNMCMTCQSIKKSQSKVIIKNLTAVIITICSRYVVQRCRLVAI